VNIDAMKLIIRATRKAQKSAESLSFISNAQTNKLDEIYGDLMDAVYIICNERTETLSQSLSYKIIQNNDLSEEKAAELLLATIA